MYTSIVNLYMTQKTVSTKLDEKDIDRLETVISARGMSKAGYARKAVLERLDEDYSSLEDEDIAIAEIRQAREEIEESSDDKSGLFPDPFGLFK